MKKNSKRIQGTRWTFVIYPGENESAPANYPDIIRLWHVGYAISPVHDPDPDNNKPHVHIYLEFEHNMGVETIRDTFMNPLGVGNLYPQLVYNPAQLCKYLSHLEDKWKDENGNRKHLYDPKDVIYSGIPYWEYILTEKGTSSVFEEIANFVEEYPEYRTYRSIYLYSVASGLILWQDYIEHNTYKINSLMKG